MPEILPFPPASSRLSNEPARAEEKRPPVTPRLGLGPTALQRQHHPAARKAWGHISYATATELASISTSLWDPLASMGYPDMVGAQRPKPRATLLPWTSHQCRPREGILPGPQCVAPVPTCPQGLTGVPTGVLKKGSQAFLRFLCQAWS